MREPVDLQTAATWHHNTREQQGRAATWRVSSWRSSRGRSGADPRPSVYAGRDRSSRPTCAVWCPTGRAGNCAERSATLGPLTVRPPARSGGLAPSSPRGPAPRPELPQEAHRAPLAGRFGGLLDNSLLRQGSQALTDHPASTQRARLEQRDREVQGACNLKGNGTATTQIECIVRAPNDIDAPRSGLVVTRKQGRAGRRDNHERYLGPIVRHQENTKVPS